MPRIRLLPGERNREFVLTHAQERLYLRSAPQPLKGMATLILDTGLRIGEALGLEWSDIKLKPVSGAQFGYLHVRDGKSRYAKRNIPLTAPVSAMLETSRAKSQSQWVFSGSNAGLMLSTSLDHLHKVLREALKLPQEFVLDSLRHTYGARLGEAGADAFTIMRLMGHSSATVSQRYVHPTPEAMERAVERFERVNREAERTLVQKEQDRLLATNLTTVVQPISVSC